MGRYANYLTAVVAGQCGADVDTYATCVGSPIRRRYAKYVGRVVGDPAHRIAEEEGGPPSVGIPIYPWLDAFRHELMFAFTQLSPPIGA